MQGDSVLTFIPSGDAPKKEYLSSYTTKIFYNSNILFLYANR